MEYTRRDFILKHVALLDSHVAGNPELEDSITVWLDLLARTPVSKSPHAIKPQWTPELRARVDARQRANHPVYGPAFLDGYRRELSAVFDYLVNPNPTIDYLLDIGRAIQITQDEYAYWVKLGKVDTRGAGVLWRIGPSLVDAMVGLLRTSDIPNLKKWDGKGQPPAVKTAGRPTSPTTMLCNRLLDAGCADFKSACKYIEDNNIEIPVIAQDSLRTAFNRAKERRSSNQK